MTAAPVAIAPAEQVAERTGALDWARVEQDLDARGSAVLQRLLSPGECQALAASYVAWGR